MKPRNKIDSLINAIKENLVAIDLCFQYLKNKNWDGFEPGDVLGVPASILLFSVIDAMGGYDSKYKGYKHFEILNKDIFGRQNLSESQLQDLYKAFRNPLTHNNLLIRSIFYSDDDRLFKIKDDKILAVNIKRLFVLCEKAFLIFKEEISQEKIEEKIGKEFKNLFESLDRKSLPSGNDSNIIGQIS